MAIISGETYAKGRGKCGNMVLQQTSNGTVMMGVAQPPKPDSPLQKDQQKVFSASIAGYGALTQEQQRGWIALGKKMKRLGKRKQPITLSGQAAYNSINNQRATLGLPLLNDALKFPEIAPGLPSVTFTATRSGTPNGPLSLIVLASADYNAASVQLWFTDSLRSSVHSIGKSAYRLLMVEGSLPAASLDAAAAWTERFRVAPVNTKIGLKLVAVTENGFVGETMLLDTLVTLS